MNEAERRFIEGVLPEIRYKNCHREIADELAVHIEQLHDCFVEEGYLDEDAWRLAVGAMGEARQLGAELDVEHVPPVDWYTWIPVAGLMGLSLLSGFYDLESGMALALVGILVMGGIRGYMKNHGEHRMNWLGLYMSLVLTDGLLTAYCGLILGR